MKPQTFALMTAAVVGGTGAMGMIKRLRQPSTDHLDEMGLSSGYGKIGGVIPTNNLFNWVRLGIGAVGFLASRDEAKAKLFNRTVAVSYAGMAIMGVIPKADTIFGTMPIFGANVGLHAGTAVAELLTEPELLAQATRVLPTKRKSKSSSSRRSRA